MVESVDPFVLPGDTAVLTVVPMGMGVELATTVCILAETPEAYRPPA